MVTLALLSGPTSPKSSMMSSWVTEVCRFVITTFVPYKKVFLRQPVPGPVSLSALQDPDTDLYGSR
jgi:hypothetical protein